MRLFRKRGEGVKPGDRVTLTGTVRAVGPPFLGSATTEALIDVDAPGLPEGYTCVLRIDVRVLEGGAA